MAKYSDTQIDQLLEEVDKLFWNNILIPFTFDGKEYYIHSAIELPYAIELIAKNAEYYTSYDVGCIIAIGEEYYGSNDVIDIEFNKNNSILVTSRIHDPYEKNGASELLDQIVEAIISTKFHKQFQFIDKENGTIVQNKEIKSWDDRYEGTLIVQEI